MLGVSRNATAKLKQLEEKTKAELESEYRDKSPRQRQLVFMADLADGPRVVRALPGVVVTELLGLAALAPILDTPLRAQVCPVRQH